jgi:hypothetical protein
MAAKHAIPVRGLLSTKSSPLFQGRFGRIFRTLPAASFGDTDQENAENLTKLGEAMTNSFDAPKAGKDDEESGIPALFTYFGQFIDHDLTFDPASSLQKQNDPDALTDFRTPAFDLDCVYGRGPDDQPYLYEPNGKKFQLGDKIQGASDPDAKDLQRNVNGRAMIGDPRNDENSIVSQLQGLVLRFHNRMVDESPKATFEEIQQSVRFHYQYTILNDFLPRIIHSSVLSQLQTDGQFDEGKVRFFNPKDDPFMPVEFSVAGYRMGHSMVRPGYLLNDKVTEPIFKTPESVKAGFKDDLHGFRPLNPHWAIDWGRFIDTDIRSYDGDNQAQSKRLQLAYRIDTSVAFPLGHLPMPAVVNAKPVSLPVRNLLRGLTMGLPSGQTVARKMGIDPLPDDKILIGTAIDNPPKGEEPQSIVKVSDVFADNCPLWTYVLAEAMQNQENVKIPVKEAVTITTPRLGPVGGRIVAEVFLGLMFGDSNSLLSMWPKWKPTIANFTGLRDFVNFALGKRFPAKKAAGV